MDAVTYTAARITPIPNYKTLTELKDPQMHRRLLPIAFTSVLLASVNAEAAIITYNSYAAFDSATGASVIDTYSAAGYSSGDKFNGATQDFHSDASVSAVLGETNYRSTARTDFNLIYQDLGAGGGNIRYCAGCNGSFELSFTSTSVGTASGVYGVGFNYGNRDSGYVATVTFGDGVTTDYSLPADFPISGFFGITSDALITSIHFGLANGGATTSGLFAIDNLEIAAAPNAVAPEPASMLLLGTGLLGAGVRRWKQRKA